MVISLYDAYSDDLDEENSIALQCLDIWDIMYEKQIGIARKLTETMMDIQSNQSLKIYILKIEGKDKLSRFAKVENQVFFA